MSNNLAPLPRIDGFARFTEVAANGPVMVAGGGREVDAFEKWTDAYLIATLGDAKAPVRLRDGRIGRIGVAAYLEYLASPEEFSSSIGPAYLTDFYLKPSFGDRRIDALAGDVVCPFPRQPLVTEFMSIYAGPGGTSTPLHQDVFQTATWMVNLRGEKSWRLCAPSDVDPAYAKRADTFQRAGELGCTVYEATLGPGDLIYLPPNWWHQVKNESATLAVTANFCSVEQAERALEEARSRSEYSSRRWVEVWSTLLEGHMPTLPAMPIAV